jgi:bacillithiol system protein YtxJ
MFLWKSKREAEPDQAVPEEEPVKSEPEKLDLAKLRDRELVVIFKHSPSCAISWHAQTQVNKFIAKHPSVPVYTVLVRQERELSQKIAALTGIRHESPQVIVIRRGEAVADASHQDVTAEFLAEATA